MRGKYSDALDYYQKAYSIFVEVLGVNHPNTKLIEKKIKDVKEKLGE